MGCDGGTIQKRIELVKLAKKPEQADAALQRQLKWQHCALSKEILQQPVVADDLGRLYRKESVLRWLLDRKSFGDGEGVAPHIESTKDVVELSLTPNPSYTPTPPTDIPSPLFICPISMREMNGRIRFVYLPCGHAVSEPALKELGSTACPECGKEFESEDAVLINPKEEELEKLKERMVRRKAVRAEEEAKRKAEKKAAKADKKASKAKDATDSGLGTSAEEHSASDEDRLKEKKRKREVDDNGPSLSHGYQPPRPVAGINMKLPDLKSIQERVEQGKKGNAIKGIYEKKADNGLAMFFQGTFGR